MKIQIKDLKPNPYRDMDNYPINQDKMQHLAASIKQTGFWDNVIARKSNGEIQIAYGHHRLEALKKVMKPTDEVEVPIKDLTDALMIQIMAKENDDDQKTLPKIIDETIRVTRQFLKEHPEEAKKYGQAKSAAIAGNIIGVSIISRFLGWEDWKVENSLQRIKLIDDKIIDRESIERLPTDYSARTFIKAVRKMELPLEKQSAAVDKILNTVRSEKDIEDAVLGEKYTTPKKKTSEINHERLKKFEDEISKATNMADDFSEQLIILLKFKEDFNSEYYNGTYVRRRFLMSIEKIQKQFELLILNKNENENESSISSKGLLGIGN